MRITAAGRGAAQFSKQPVKRQVARPAGHRVVAQVHEAASLEAAVAEPKQPLLCLSIDPGVNAVYDDVVELGEWELQCRRKIGSVKMDVRDCRGSCEAAGMIDVDRHRVD